MNNVHHENVNIQKYKLTDQTCIDFQHEKNRRDF